MESRSQGTNRDNTLNKKYSVGIEDGSMVKAAFVEDNSLDSRLHMGVHSCR